MSRTLLVADDSNTIHKVVELTFRDTDFVVDCVSDGDSAAQRLEAGKYELVLADVVMPGTDGYDLCRAIKRSANPLPVLLLAGTFESFDHDQARECGADGCLLKPFDSRTLLERVSELLAERESISESAFELRESPDEADEPAEPAEPAEPQSTRDASDTLPSTPPELNEEPAAAARALDESQIRAIVDEVTREVSENVAARLVDDIVPRITEVVVRQHVRRLEGPADE